MTLQTGEQVQNRANRAMFGLAVIISKSRLDGIKNLVDTNTMTTRQKASWNAIMARTFPFTISGPISPWYIPENYGSDGTENAAALKTLRDDSEAAVDYAIRYAIYGDSQAAQAVANILERWSTITVWNTNNGSKLNWNDGWTLFMQAAMLVKGSAAYTSTIETNFKNATTTAINILRVAYAPYTNNWASWGVVMELLYGMLMNDRAIFDAAIYRWQQVFNTVVVNNVPIEEVHRQGGSQGDGSDGLLYSNFMVNAVVLGAEIARINGEWLYDYVSPNGSSLKGLVENVRHWTRYPDEFPYSESGLGKYTNRILAYIDIVHALWPHAESQWLIENKDIVQDYYGIRRADVIYRNQPLMG